MNVTNDFNDLECRYVHHLNESQACSFILSAESCQADSGLVNFLKLVYCLLPSQLFVPAMISMVGYLSVLFIFVATTADEYFCPVLAFIAKMLHMSENLTGVTLVAFGNGAADVFCASTAVMHIRSSDAGLAFGALLGGAMFISTVVVGSVSIVAPFKSIERPLLRDLIMLIGASFWTLYIINNRRVRMLEAIGFIVLYVVYVFIVIFGRLIYKSYSRVTSVIRTQQGLTVQEENDQSEQDDFPENQYNPVFANTETKTDDQLPLLPTSEEPVLPDNFNSCLKKIFVEYSFDEFKSFGYFQRFYAIIKYPISLSLKLTCPRVDVNELNYSWNRVLNTFHCVSVPLFVEATTGVLSYKIGSVVPIYYLSVPLSLLLAFCVWVTTLYSEPPRYILLYAFAAFTTSVIWVYLTASEIVAVLSALGVMMNVSDVIMGLSFLAMGNSIADLTTDIVMARREMQNAAVSACFAGPVFNILIGIGFPFTLRTAIYGTLEIQSSFLQTILPYFLLVNVCFSLVFLTRNGFHFTRTYGACLITIYAVYIVVCIFVELYW